MSSEDCGERILRQDPPWKRLSNEEYAAMIVEQARLNTEFEASKRRVQELINDAMMKERNNG